LCVCKHVPLATQDTALVCPVENGATGHRTDCERCGVCWRPLPQDGRCVSMPLIGGTDYKTNA
jgi:hypothetical protein